MNWQQGNPTGKGLYLCRTTEGFGGMEVGYQVVVWNGYWNRLPQNPTINRFGHIIHVLID